MYQKIEARKRNRRIEEIKGRKGSQGNRRIEEIKGRKGSQGSQGSQWPKYWFIVDWINHLQAHVF